MSVDGDQEGREELRLVAKERERESETEDVERTIANEWR